MTGCFNFEVISGYDDAIRARVALEGYSEFAKIETDEVENTIKKSDSTAKSQGKFKTGGTKANGICFRYNSEDGCTGKCFFHAQVQ